MGNQKCDECEGTGMFDVLSSIPCKCMEKKTNITNLINRIVRFKEKAKKEGRYYDETMFRTIEVKLINKIKK